MNAERPGIDELPSPAAWLLERGVHGLGLTKTHALQRAIVREAADWWPQWWNHELFGPPQREAELPVLQETHAALRRLRLVRRQRETLRTTVRGRELLLDPGELARTLHEDLEAGGFEGDAWRVIESALQQEGPLTSDRLMDRIGPVLLVQGWRAADGAPLEGWALSGALQPVLCRAEGYGLLDGRRSPSTFELTAAGHRLAAGAPALGDTAPAAAGDAALVFDAELLNAPGVEARLTVLERQPLTALHDAIQQAFGWWDDHLYSFWLDGSFFGPRDVELTSPITPDEGVATADVPISELDLRRGQRIGYVFDFGDEWRVRLTLRERTAAEPADYPRVVELSGTPPPQYEPLEDEDATDQERDERLAFAVPPISEPDEGTRWLDPGDPDERALLIRAAHPELDTDAETVEIDGRKMNPRLHLAVHEIVAAQLADDDPPDVWATAQRLSSLGYGRHEVLHMLGAAMSPQLWAALRDQHDYDPDEHRAALHALPDSWERGRPGGAAPPAARAAHAAEAKSRRKAARAARRRNRRR